jgi:hypothetical protein
VDYLPPGFVQRIGDERFPRFVIRDGLGQFWARDRWSDEPAEAMVYLRESEAMRTALQLHEIDGAKDTFKACVIVSVTKNTWKLEELVAFLKRWGRFLVMQNEDTREVHVEIHWDELQEEDRPSE